ncbi:MAG: 3'-5' exonuclease [Verrucomicrobiota bacterium]
MSWTEQPIHFIDFEGSAASGILEYGVVTIQHGEIVSARTRLCRPTGRVRSEDVAVHGIDPAAVAGRAPFSDEFALFAGLRESGPLAAHFAGVENGLIKSVWPYPRAAPDFARLGGRVLEWGPWIDTGRLYPQIYDGLASANLEALVAAFGLQPALDKAAAKWCPPERVRYHAALYDALAGALLLARLTREAATSGVSTAWLLTKSTLDPEKRASLEQGELF